MKDKFSPRTSAVSSQTAQAAPPSVKRAKRTRKAALQSNARQTFQLFFLESVHEKGDCDAAPRQHLRETCAAFKRRTVTTFPFRSTVLRCMPSLASIPYLISQAPLIMESRSLGIEEERGNGNYKRGQQPQPKPNSHSDRRYARYLAAADVFMVHQVSTETTTHDTDESKDCRPLLPDKACKTCE